MAVQIQIRRDTAANWTSTDPTLAQGEMGYETDTGKFKFGDGSTAWTSLSYFDVQAAQIDSETATDGYVLTADGAGGADWEEDRVATNLFGGLAPDNQNSWTNNSFLSTFGDTLGFETDTTFAANSYTPTGNYTKVISGSNVHFYCYKHYLYISPLAESYAMLKYTVASTAKTELKVFGQFSSSAAYGGEIRFWGTAGGSGTYMAVRFLKDVTTYPDFPYRIALFTGTGTTYGATDGTEIYNLPSDIRFPYYFWILFSAGGRIRVRQTAYNGQLLGAGAPETIFDITNGSYLSNFEEFVIYIPGSYQRCALDSVAVS